MQIFHSTVNETEEEVETFTVYSFSVIMKSGHLNIPISNVSYITECVQWAGGGWTLE